MYLTLKGFKECARVILYNALLFDGTITDWARFMFVVYIDFDLLF